MVPVSRLALLLPCGSPSGRTMSALGMLAIQTRWLPQRVTFCPLRGGCAEAFHAGCSSALRFLFRHPEASFSPATTSSKTRARDPDDSLALIYTRLTPPPPSLHIEVIFTTQCFFILFILSPPICIWCCGGGVSSQAAPGQLSVTEIFTLRHALGLLPARRYHLFGHPIAQSMSPTLHNTGFTALGLPHRYTLAEGSELAVVRAAMAEPDFGGASVTIPHKQVWGLPAFFLWKVWWVGYRGVSIGYRH